MSKRIKITETDPEFILGLAAIIMGEGALPVVFEVPDDYDVDGYEGLALDAPALPTPSKPMLEAKFPEVAAWLDAYNGTFDFYRSLKAQYIAKGMLSEKQIDCVKRAMANDVAQGKTLPAGTVREFDLKPGTVLVLSKFIANKISQQAGHTRAHRSVDVLSVEAETAKAYRVKVRLSARRTSHCGICGLTLENPESIAAGIGPICANNYGLSYGEGSLDEMNAKLSTTVEVTTWIPKKSIKERIDPTVNTQVAS